MGDSDRLQPVYPAPTTTSSPMIETRRHGPPARRRRGARRSTSRRRSLAHPRPGKQDRPETVAPALDDAARPDHGSCDSRSCSHPCRRPPPARRRSTEPADRRVPELPCAFRRPARSRRRGARRADLSRRSRCACRYASGVPVSSQYAPSDMANRAPSAERGPGTSRAPPRPAVTAVSGRAPRAPSRRCPR